MSFRRAALRALCAVHAYPSKYFTLSPFKTLEFDHLTRNVHWTGNEVVLDIGCGSGLQTVLLAMRARTVVGLDVDQQSLATARRVAGYLDGKIDCRWVYARLEEAQFPAEYFDKIFSFSVIEHIANYEEVLRESYRILKKGGEMIFSCDTLETIDEPALLAEHKRRFYVQQYFRKEELERVMKAAGFRDVVAYPLFRSDFARELFKKTITENYPAGHLHSVMGYFRLRAAERAGGGEANGKGIFLIVKARK